MGGNDLQFNNGAMVIKTVAGVAGAVTAAPTDPCCCDTTSSCWYHYTVEYLCGASPHWGTVTFIEKTCAGSAPGPTSWSSIADANSCDLKYEIWVIGGACSGVGDCPDPSVGSYPAVPATPTCPCHCWYHFRVFWICCDSSTLGGGHWDTVTEIVGDRTCAAAAPGPPTWVLDGYRACADGDVGSPDQQYDIWVEGEVCDSPGVCSGVTTPTHPSITPVCTCPCPPDAVFNKTLTLDLSGITINSAGGTAQPWSSPGDYATVFTDPSGCGFPGYVQSGPTQSITLVNWVDSASGPVSAGPCILKQQTLYTPGQGVHFAEAGYANATAPSDATLSFDPTFCELVGPTSDCEACVAIFSDPEGSAVNASLTWGEYLGGTVTNRSCKWLLSALGCVWVGGSNPLDQRGLYVRDTSCGGSDACDGSPGGGIIGDLTIG